MTEAAEGVVDTPGTSVFAGARELINAAWSKKPTIDIADLRSLLGKLDPTALVEAVKICAKETGTLSSKTQAVIQKSVEAFAENLKRPDATSEERRAIHEHIISLVLEARKEAQETRGLLRQIVGVLAVGLVAVVGLMMRGAALATGRRKG